MTNPKPFHLLPTDRTLLESSPDDFFAFCKWYFQDWTPFPYQEAFYNDPRKDKLLISGIRTGKTACVAAGFAHYMWRNPSCRIANASISADQANIVFNEVLNLIHKDRFQHWIKHIEKHPYPKITLHNGAEAWFRSVGYEAQLWRGHEFDWINVDEAAYIGNETAITTLKGRLIGVNSVTHQPRDGLFTMTSTPKGRGWLYERWKLGDSNVPGSRPDKYLSMRARTTDNILLSRQQIDDLMEDMTDRERQQELEGVFLESAGQIFSPYDLYQACTTDHPEVQLLNKKIKDYLGRHQQSEKWYGKGEITRYELDPEDGHWYLQSWDLGKKTDKSGRGAMVGVIFDITKKPWTLVAYRWEQNAGYVQAMHWIEEWDQKYRNQGRSRMETMIDATGKGDVVNSILEEERKLDVDGAVYSAASKPLYIHSAQVMFERHDYFRMPFIRRLFDQFSGYEVHDKDLPQDIVMAMAQAAYGARLRYGESDSKGTQIATRSAYRQPGANLDRYNQRRAASRNDRRKSPRR